MCWQGRQEIRAVIDSGEGLAVAACVDATLVVSTGFSAADWEGVNVKSTSSHQSNSVHFSTPHAVNHFLFPNGTKK